MKSFKSYLTEGRPSQRHPLEGHDYHKKTDAQLEYIAKDAHKAAEAMKGHNEKAENKYRDQANDSATVRYWRKKNGMPDWYKKKYGHMKEEVVTEAADYSVDVIHHHVDDAGQKTKKTYTYNVKNALTTKHAKRIAMQKHENAVKLGKGESYSTSSSNVRMQEDVMTEAQTSKTGIVETEVYGTKAYHAKCMEPGCKFESKRYDRIKQAQDAAQKHAKTHFGKNVKEEVEQIDELSNEMLGRYKKAAGASASAADKAGDFAKGNKRFSGIVKATKKQFANDMKKEDVQLDEGEGIVTPKKTHFGEPPKGTYAYERKYGAYTAKGELRKKPNPNKPPVKEDVELDEDWQKVNKSDRTDGLSQKAVDAYRRENPGSKLQTAVTEKNPKGKRAARRKSFCSRMSGMKKRLTNPENARDPDSPINKALRRWNC